MRPGIIILAAVGMLLATYATLFYAPTERIMGHVQRIFYFHMGTVWVATVAFTIVLISSILFLIKKNRKWDILAYCSAEIGVVFIVLTIISGSIWAKPTWGTWWTWDPQVTATFILFILYLVYLVLRSSAGNDHKKARYAAVFAIIAYIDLPFVYISARVMRGISPVVFGPGGGGIDPLMMHTLLLTIGGFTFLMIALLWERFRIEDMKMRLEMIRSGGKF